MVSLAEIIEIWQNSDMTARTLEHLVLFAVAITLSTIIGITIGVGLTRIKQGSQYVFNFLNIIETTPTLALLVLLIPLVGIGWEPTIIASVLYCILPIARNTYEGLVNISTEYIQIPKALGLTEREILLKIRFPLSFPFIASGIRIAVVFTFGVVTIGGLISAGGLGQVLQVGFYRQNQSLVLVAGLWIGLLAVIFDGAMAILERFLKRRFSQ